MKRIEVLLPAEHYHQLKRDAVRRGCSVSALVRNIIEQEYGSASVSARMAMVQRIASMQLPVTDWPTMENQIEQGRVGCAETVKIAKDTE